MLSRLPVDKVVDKIVTIFLHSVHFHFTFMNLINGEGLKRKSQISIIPDSLKGLNRLMIKLVESNYLR